MKKFILWFITIIFFVAAIPSIIYLAIVYLIYLILIMPFEGEE